MALPELAGKVAVVTGGAAGMGKGMAERFLAEGMHVVIADIEEPALEATADELGVIGIPTDVSDAASVQALADARSSGSAPSTSSATTPASRRSPRRRPHARRLALDARHEPRGA